LMWTGRSVPSGSATSVTSSRPEWKLDSRRDMAAASAVSRTANCCLSTLACRISEASVGSLYVLTRPAAAGRRREKEARLAAGEERETGHERGGHTGERTQLCECAHTIWYPPPRALGRDGQLRGAAAAAPFSQ
jgi:hypothetical protein